MPNEEERLWRGEASDASDLDVLVDFDGTLRYTRRPLCAA